MIDRLAHIYTTGLFPYATVLGGIGSAIAGVFVLVTLGYRDADSICDSKVAARWLLAIPLLTVAWPLTILAGIAWLYRYAELPTPHRRRPRPRVDPDYVAALEHELGLDHHDRNQP